MSIIPQPYTNLIGPSPAASIENLSFGGREELVVLVYHCYCALPRDSNIP